MRPNPVSFLLLSMVLGILIVALVAITAMSLQIEWVSDRNAQTLSAEGVQTLSVRSIVGSITIIGENRTDILLRYEVETIFGRTVLDKVRVEVTGGKDASIAAKSTLDMPLYNIHMELWVPSDLPLRTVTMDHGNVKVSDVVSIDRCDMDNGLMVLERIGTIGNLSVDNGDLEVLGSGTMASASVANGNLDAELADISHLGTRLDVDNGDVSVDFPETSSLDFDLTVSIGHLSVEGFEPDYTSKYFGRMAGSINGGGPLLRVDVYNGNILLRGSEGGR
jgi:hypothetical protein